MANREFQVLFCEQFDCPLSEYERRAFRMCLYWHAKWLAPMMHRLNSRFFAEDFKFIRCLGESIDLPEVAADLLNFQDANAAKPGLWRTTLRFRVSGRKARRLAQQVFAPDGELEFQTP